MDELRIIRWETWNGDGLQHAALRADGAGFLAEGIVIGSGPEPFAATWRIHIDAAWMARRVTVDLPGSRSNIELVADGKGNWSRDGRFLTGLDGVMEPDISVTPFTNSFPVRRLGLRKGESADIRTAYIDAVDGKLFADPQRYTCLEEGRRYLYQSLDSDFCREITFDPDGFVSSYPGLFRRIA